MRTPESADASVAGVVHVRPIRPRRPGCLALPREYRRPDEQAGFDGPPPWNIGEPQPALAALVKMIRSDVLDAGNPMTLRMVTSRHGDNRLTFNLFRLDRGGNETLITEMEHTRR